jgi:hypothetical protein
MIIKRFIRWLARNEIAQAYGNGVGNGYALGYKLGQVEANNRNLIRKER